MVEASYVGVRSVKVLRLEKGTVVRWQRRSFIHSLIQHCPVECSVMLEIILHCFGSRYLATCGY